MSKYNSLWEYVQSNGSPSFQLTFEEIQNIAADALNGMSGHYVLLFDSQNEKEYMNGKD